MHSVASQCVERSLTYLMFRKFAYKVSVVAVIGAADGHIGFAAAVAGVKTVDLNEAVKTGSGKAEHDLAECYNFHIVLFFKMVSLNIL